MDEIRNLCRMNGVNFVGYASLDVSDPETRYDMTYLLHLQLILLLFQILKRARQNNIIMNIPG